MEIIKNFEEFVFEKKKINAGFQAYLDKTAGKKSDKDDKDEKGEKDKDKSKEKEEKDEKCDKDDNKKGLTDKQKKLPPALQKAILKRMNK